MNVILSCALCLLTLTWLCTVSLCVLKGGGESHSDSSIFHLIELQWTFSVQSGAVQTGAALLAIVVWGDTNK